METKKDLKPTHHMIFDAVGCDKKKISDKKFVSRLLKNLTEITGSKVLSGPKVVVKDPNPENAGVTGISVISFSHMSAHTFTDTKTGHIFIDIFSCRPFDENKARDYLFQELGISKEQAQCQLILYPWEEKK